MTEIALLNVFVFFLGAAAASFLNVLAGGTGSIRENLQRKHSRCDSCTMDLRWWELVPVVSWVVLRGRCSRCSSVIPVFHPLSEILLGIAFVLGYVSASSTAVALGYVGLIMVLYFFSVYDLFHGIVPRKLLFPLIAGAFLGRIVLAIAHAEWQMLVTGLIGALSGYAFFVILNFLSRKGVLPREKKSGESFGWGDANFALLIGLVLGWPLSFIALWIAVALGGLVGIVILLVVRQRGATMPFIPFLSVGTLVALVWGYAIMDWMRLYLSY